MKRRLHNPNLAKIHRNYTVEEIAGLYGVFKGTVRAWIKAGLPVINDKRPMLILGSDLVAFHQARRTNNKQQCKPGEMYCVRCRAPEKPAGDMADCRIITEKIGNLEAICPDCDKIMNRRVNLSKLMQICGKLHITLPQELEHIIDYVNGQEVSFETLQALCLAMSEYIDKLKRGEFICNKCGLRKDGELNTEHDF